MKLSLSRDSLASRLAIATRAISTRTALPALSGVLLSVDDRTVRLRATDLELGLDLSLEGEVETPGQALLPGRLLSDIARSLPDSSLNLELREAERDVQISCGGSTFQVRLLPSEEFPKLPTPEGDSVSLPAPALIETIERVALAASRDEARPVLTGVLVSAEERSLTMVATDSYRLSVKHTELEQPVSSKLEANVPARALRELTRIVAQEESAEVEIFLLANQAVFRCDGVVLSSRLIEGQFPNYKQLLPESYEHEVRLPRDEFAEVVRRISLLAQKNAPLRLAFSEGELTVSAETPDVGGAEESLPAPFQGEPLEIGFNPEFLRAGTEIMDADEVVLKLISSLRPGLLQPAGRDDFSYLVMPIRLNV